MVLEAIKYLSQYNMPDDLEFLGYMGFGRTETPAAFSVGDVEVQKGDICYVVHASIPELATYDLNYFLRRVRLELKIMGREVEKEALDRTHVLGFTKPQVAKLATRFGFSTHVVEVPEQYRASMEYWENDLKVLRGRKDLGKPINTVLLCYQSGEDFVRRFRGQNP